MLVAAAAAHAQTRVASEAETASLQAYLQQLRPGVALRPRFEIRREGAEWRIDAWAESPPQRAAWSLCLTTRSDYRYDARARRWRENGVDRQYAWLDRARDCGVVQERVELKHTLAERDIVTMLEQQASLLQGARLLFAGNTQCAAQRAHNFKLVSIDVGADQLYQLAYRSDRGGHATVSVRKRGPELTAWNVRC